MVVCGDGKDVTAGTLWQTRVSHMSDKTLCHVTQARASVALADETFLNTPTVGNYGRETEP